LQDNDRATVVGSKTFGKGLVQSVRGLGNGAGLAVTIAKYLTPDGRDINKEGIYPDIKVELSEQQREMLRDNRTKIGTPEDPQYAKALEVLQQNITAHQSGSTEASVR
jgi:carboxyl-terminal processing protease